MLEIRMNPKIGYVARHSDSTVHSIFDDETKFQEFDL